MAHWIWDSFFYHIFPLGLCAAPSRNDLGATPQPRLQTLLPWLDHLQNLGVNAVYLGPVFESSTHGYDTVDLFRVDRRLGTQTTLVELADQMHRRGIRLVLDGVFHHVGRDFWAFRDVIQNGKHSPYRHWFHLDFSRPGPRGDGFHYARWQGHDGLVKLNLAHPEVREHLLHAVDHWRDRLGLDGLRLDAADCLDRDFMRDLARHCHGDGSDFCLIGEVIHGDYRRWIEAGLDSVTNYEAYKGLWSSLNDANYFEIAHCLDRQFGEPGLYAGVPLYAFADNHDVDRVASRLHDAAHLYPLYCLLMTMPGVPSVYYGSEWGWPGRKAHGSDAPLRPSIEIDRAAAEAPHPDLCAVIQRLARLRSRRVALRHGDYTTLHVAPRTLAFSRSVDDQRVVVVVHAGDEPTAVDLAIPGTDRGRLRDELDGGAGFPIRGGRVRVDPVHPRWARVFAVEAG